MTDTVIINREAEAETKWGYGPPFSTQVPYFQTTWDSTSLGWIKDCPRLYQYQMLLQWTPRSKNVHLIFGQLYASGQEQYSKARAGGQDHNEATRTMVRWVLEHSGERSEDGQWLPWSSEGHKDANIKNRYTLIRTLVWSVEQRQGSPFKTVIKSNGKPAVEESFNFYAFDIGGEPIHLAGHIDEIVEEVTSGDLYVADDKTTKGPLDAQYFRQYSPHNQMSLYSVAGKIILARKIKGVLIRAAQIGVTFSRFATQQVTRPEPVLDEWFRDTQYWIGQAYEFAKAGYWPQNDKSCGNFGGCPFQQVCARSPNFRAAWLKEDFAKNQWNPLIARGE